VVEVSCATAHAYPGEPPVTSDPAIFVESAVPEHLEVLNVSRASSLRAVEDIHHALVNECFGDKALTEIRAGIQDSGNLR
jgi:hypothetical protein